MYTIFFAISTVAFLTLQVHQVSGKSIEHFQNTDRIVGGSDAEPGEFPWQISLQLVGSNLHTCGGAIISPTKIASAAHCCIFPAFLFQVNAGAHNILANETSQQLVGVERYVIHPEYNQTGYLDNDACRIHLASPLVLNERVATLPICSSEPEAGSVGVATGWGTTKESGEFFTPPALQKIELEFMARDQCDAIYDSLPNYPNVTENMNCAGGIAGQGACNGDSGGPLWYRAGNCLAGIASWVAKPCGQSGFPTVFVNPINANLRAFYESDD